MQDQNSRGARLPVVGVIRVVASVVFTLLLIIVLTQDLQIFAELPLSLSDPARRSFLAPPGAQDVILSSPAGVPISYRRWAPRGDQPGPYRVAILHHGNGGTMDSLRDVPQTLADLGIATYVVEYPGYGKSGGWPSERGIYAASEAVYTEAIRREGATPKEVMVIGHSLGGGPASHLAARHGTGALILAAAFTSLPEQAHQHPFFFFLSPFVWTVFPNRKNIADLEDTCLLVYHGGRDNTIPSWMANGLVEAYRGRRGAVRLIYPDEDHNSIVSRISDSALQHLHNCR